MLTQKAYLGPNLTSVVDLFCENIVNVFMTETLLYRNQYINLLDKSMDWFLYGRDFSHERVEGKKSFTIRKKVQS